MSNLFLPAREMTKRSRKLFQQLIFPAYKKNNWQDNINFGSNKEKLSNIQIVIYTIIYQKKDQIHEWKKQKEMLIRQ